MSGAEALDRASARPGPSVSVDPFLDAKLHWPPTRADWVRRDRLLDRLDTATRLPVTLVAAPAGYGKTILAAQWVATQVGVATAWVSLDSGDNDPSRLWTHVAAALDRVGCMLPTHQPSRVAGVSDREAPPTLLPAIVEALEAVPEEIVLVLDDFHFVQEQSCHEQMEFLIERLPPQAHLVITSRADPGLRLGRLRASGALGEIRAGDLGFTPDEATELFTHESIGLSPQSISTLMQRTEGWPAGLYLAALTLAGSDDPDESVRTFSGGNRFVGDYLTEEVLSRHSGELREFIKAVSILDRVSASLCDHVAGVTNAQVLLDELEHTNLFLVSLDQDHSWFRFHYLFAAVARRELEITRPHELGVLHARAADWFREHGHVDEAVHHSLAAGDNEAAAGLVQQHWLQYVDAGRMATVLGWLEALGPTPPGPAAIVTAAWLAALSGNETRMNQCFESLATFRDYGPLPDGTRSVESAIALITSLCGYGGPAEMMTAARRAVELETDTTSPFYACANAALGHAYYLAGDLEQSVTRLSRASRSDRAPRVIQSLSLSAESFAHAERGDLERSRECAELAIDIVEINGLRAMPQLSWAYTALGQAQHAAGKTNDALSTLERGLALLQGTVSRGPWGMIHHLLAFARVAAEAGRTDQARELLSELDALTARYSDGMAEVRARISAVRQLVQAEAAARILDAPLTGREVEVLRLFEASKTLQQIASELHLSSNTVRTHRRTIYRKLGAHSRAEAVRAGRQQGLI